MRHRWFMTTALALLAFGSGSGTPAYAQDKSTPIASGREDIVVTARRHTERLQDVPVPVSALDPKMIQSGNIHSIESLNSLVPALNVGQSQLGSGGIIYLRGVGSATGNPLVDQSVSVVIDSVSMASANLMFAGQYDVQRIEVLRGPQSLFFGKTSPGGVISFTSKDPGDTFEAEIGGGYEFEAKERYGSLMLSGPLTDQIGARIFARYGAQDGFYDIVTVPTTVTTSRGVAIPSTAKTFPNSTDFFTRGTLTFNKPSDRFNIRAKATYSHRKLDSYPIGWQRTYCPLGGPQVGGVLITDPNLRLDDCTLNNTIVSGNVSPTELAGYTLTGIDGDGLRNVEIVLASIEANYKVNDSLTLTSVTGLYKLRDFAAQDQSALPTTDSPSATYVTNRQFTEEVRLASSFDGPVNFLAGALYEKRKQGSINEAPDTPRWETGYQNQSAWSLFAQLQYKPTEALEISAGARYSHEQKSFYGFLQKPVFTNLVLPPGKDEISFNNLSPEVTVSYHFTPQVMMYASYKEGFKSGGYDVSSGYSVRVLAGVPNIYQPEHAEGYEVGLKSKFFEDQLTFNAAAYTYDYTNLQVTAFDAVSLIVATTNAAAATVKGFEFDFAFRPKDIEGLTFRGAGSFMDGKYKDFISTCYTGQSIAAGCSIDVIPGGAREGQDMNGRRILQAPRFSGSIGFSYDRLIANDSLLLTLTSDVKYSSKYETQQQQAPGTQQPSYYMFNASLTVGDPDGAWEISLVGKNLNNEIIRSVGQNVPLTGARTGTTTAVTADALAIMAERGRQVMLEFKIRPSDLFGD